MAEPVSLKRSVQIVRRGAKLLVPQSLNLIPRLPAQHPLDFFVVEFSMRQIRKNEECLTTSRQTVFWNFDSGLNSRTTIRPRCAVRYHILVMLRRCRPAGVDATKIPRMLHVVVQKSYHLCTVALTKHAAHFLT